ncbi:similar to Saccharomyces cerevisiae YIL114C POR2 Putative mitochondrial porin (voltage-dependent anion channel) [Maudiozyma saulgeensis]|uniref:Similar to Saccharomyces cerevisiae YIL114C POR2 Putative mitochondrial porin (Voltage-dependent anion channel) n=1 Tax=Maudiozyma saulgeensis TaxID=1789683 RepID=A0A1X7R4G5_9SACH|nr:similar to Saccharomyces cerevisiae YIL114C POR2 Putative mitochondrial porin (voltage-dependent anion channel) [Kazachstania saulgeensis]
MAPPFFSDISQNINGLLNRDYFHNTPTAFSLRTNTKSNVNFSVNARQNVRDGPLITNMEARMSDKATGLTYTQGWSNENKLNTRIEFKDLAPGLKTELASTYIPNGAKTAKVNLSFVQPFFASRCTFDLLKNPSFVGNLTLSHEGTVGGAEFGYDIISGTLSRYAVALGYSTKQYTLGVFIDDSKLTSVSFFQKVSQDLQVGAKATLNPKISSNVNMELATRYLPDETSQIKAKITDIGKLTVSYKQTIRTGITLGIGASMDALKLNEPVQKIGWSLNFSA